MDKSKPTTAGVRGAPQIYTNEFKHEAVARMKTCANVSALALELGVKRNRLYKWAKLLDAGGLGDTFRSPGRPPLEAETELDRLRRDNARLELENNILKKAKAYFAGRKP